MAEVRKLGANDLQIGEGTVVSPGGKTVQEIDARHIPIAYGTANDNVTGYNDIVFSVEDAIASSIDVRGYSTLSEADTAAVAAGKQLLISSTASVTGDTTISSSLIVPKGGMFSISAGVTLTLNSPTIEAGYYQIFSFADSPSQVLPSAGAQWSSTPVAHYAVKMDWFGAVPDAVIPASSSAMGTLPTGTDSSSAIRRAVKYVNTGSPKYNQSTSSSQMTLLGTPNGVYYITGANLLGSQLTTGQTDTGMIFDGQGCSFLWNPTGSTDAFIDYLEQYWRPVFKNFNLLAVGFSGSKGLFVHVSNIAGSPSLAAPHFYNISVEGGKTSDYVTGFVLNNSLTKVFHIEDTSNNDRFYVENCWFSQFDKFIHCTNAESVSWTVHKCTLQSWENTAVFFDFSGDYSGGFRITESDVLMKGNEQILFRANPYTGSSGIGDFIINNCRVETPSNGTDIFTVIHGFFGKFYIEKVNFGYGATISADSVLTYLSHPATVTFRDCVIPGKIKVKTRLSTDYNNLSNVKTQLIIDTCEFSTSYPRFFWIKDVDESEQTFMEMLADLRSFRPIRIENSQPGSAYINNLSMDTSALQQGGIPSEEVIAFHRIGTNTYPYVDSFNMYLPLGALVTSIKVIAGTMNQSVINGIKVHIGSWNATSATSATLFTKNELIDTGTNIGVAIPIANDVENKLSAQYTLSGTPVGDVAPAYLIVKYRAFRGLLEKPGSSVATMIGP